MLRGAETGSGCQGSQPHALPAIARRGVNWEGAMVD